MKAKWMKGFVLILVLSLVMFGNVSAAKLTKVRIATLPYFDYTGLVAAKALGLDQELGLDFDFVPFPLEPQGLQAMLNGSIDVCQGAIGSFIPLMPQAPDLRIFLSLVQFKGFMFVGRKGEITPFQDFAKQYGDDFTKAQKATLAQFKGKTILLVKSSFEPTVIAALAQVGLTPNDVTILDFQSDAQAALAFLRGIGDLYTGSLPQLIRILKEPGYIVVAGNEVLGPAGLWYSNAAVTAKYLKENYDIVKQIVAIYYRAMVYLKQQPEKTIRSMVEYLNRQAATNLTLQDGKDLIENGFEEFSTIQDSLIGVYNPKAPNYWRLQAEYYVRQNEELGKIKAGSVNIDEIIVQEKIFNELVKDRKLLNWVQSPLKK